MLLKGVADEIVRKNVPRGNTLQKYEIRLQRTQS